MQSGLNATIVEPVDGMVGINGPKMEKSDETLFVALFVRSPWTAKLKH